MDHDLLLHVTILVVIVVNHDLFILGLPSRFVVNHRLAATARVLVVDVGAAIASGQRQECGG
jgi:hypothetical protein